MTEVLVWDIKYYGLLYKKEMKNMYETIVKRILDLGIALVGLIILAPLFLVLGLAIYIDDPGPVFFCQKRVGKNKIFFQLCKFDCRCFFLTPILAVKGEGVVEGKK